MRTSTRTRIRTHTFSHWRRQRLTGLILICTGAAFFLDQLGFISLVDLWRYWPLTLVVIGAARMIDAPTARGVSSGLWTMFIGAWLYGNFEGWFGMDFSNSWPFLLIGWGVILLLVPVFQRQQADNRNPSGPHDEESHHAH